MWVRGYVYYWNSASSPACVTVVSKSSSFFRIHQFCCTLAVLFEWKACAIKHVMCTYCACLSCCICKKELVWWPGLCVRVVRTKADLSSAFALCLCNAGCISHHPNAALFCNRWAENIPWARVPVWFGFLRQWGAGSFQSSCLSRLNARIADSNHLSLRRCCVLPTEV